MIIIKCLQQSNYNFIIPTIITAHVSSKVHSCQSTETNCLIIRRKRLKYIFQLSLIDVLASQSLTVSYHDILLFHVPTIFPLHESEKFSSGNFFSESKCVAFIQMYTLWVNT